MQQPCRRAFIFSVFSYGKPQCHDFHTSMKIMTLRPWNHKYILKQYEDKINGFAFF